MSAVNPVFCCDFPLLSPFPLWVSCQVCSFWRAFTSLNDIWQQWKATENCLLIRAKLVDGTDEVVSQKCSHIQVMTFCSRTQELNGIQLHYIMPLVLTASSPSPDCFVYVVMRIIYLHWFRCIANLICSWTLANCLWSVLTNRPKDTEISILLKSNCVVL